MPIFIIILTSRYVVMKTALLDCANENKKITLEHYRHQRAVNLTNRQVPSWWQCLRKCHHLSVNEAVEDSCSLAIIYQCFNDLGFSYTPQPVDGFGLGSL